MPFKASADRRHKFPKAKYQVTNWPDYDAALIRRGSLTVWLTDEAIAGWHAPVSGKRGGLEWRPSASRARHTAAPEEDSWYGS
jgi:hypothetical protein